MRIRGTTQIQRILPALCRYGNAFRYRFPDDGGNPVEVYWEKNTPFGSQLRGHFRIVFPGTYTGRSLSARRIHTYFLLVNAFYRIQLRLLYHIKNILQLYLPFFSS